MLEEVQEEVDALEAVYGDQQHFDAERREFSITVSPRGEHSRRQNLSCVLVFALPPSYPAEAAPPVKLANCRGLSDHEQQHLLRRVRLAGEEYVGMPALFGMAEAGFEKLAELSERGECCICFEEVKLEAEVGECRTPEGGAAPWTVDVGIVLPCGHVLHRECFARWVDEWSERSSGRAKTLEAVGDEERRAGGAVRDEEFRLQQSRETREAMESRLAELEPMIAELIEEAGREETGARRERRKKRDVEGESAAVRLRLARAEVEQLARQVEQLRRAEDAAAERLLAAQARESDVSRRRQEMEAVIDSPCPTCREVVPFGAFCEWYERWRTARQAGWRGVLWEGDEFAESSRVNPGRAVGGGKGETKRKKRKKRKNA